MERSVRVEGTTERLTPSESQIYFDTRPVGSRIGAWASPQSQRLSDRSELEQRVKDFSTKFNPENKDDLDKSVKIPVPEYWGGLRIIPERIEFWQGRKNRQHDRVSLVKNEGRWEAERLAP
jgi:pyridoxamine 5'-phosphate oxidase